MWAILRELEIYFLRRRFYPQSGIFFSSQFLARTTEVPFPKNFSFPGKFWSSEKVREKYYKNYRDGKKFRKHFWITLELKKIRKLGLTHRSSKKFKNGSYACEKLRKHFRWTRKFAKIWGKMVGKIWSSREFLKYCINILESKINSEKF